MMISYAEGDHFAVRRDYLDSAIAIAPGRLALTGCGKSRFRDEIIQEIWHNYWAVTLLIGREKPTHAFFRSLLRASVLCESAQRRRGPGSKPR